MKKITANIEQIVGYEASDGTQFYTYFYTEDEREKAKNNCLEYENSAQGVISARVRRIKIGETSEYSLYYTGSDEHRVEIFKPETETDIKDLEMYLSIKGKNREFLNEKAWQNIAKTNNEIIITWNFDEDWFDYDTLETIMGRIKENYYDAMIKKEKENE